MDDSERIRRLEIMQAKADLRIDHVDRTLDALWEKLKTEEAKSDRRHAEVMDAISVNRATSSVIQGSGKLLAAIVGVLSTVVALGVTVSRFLWDVFRGVGN